MAVLCFPRLGKPNPLEPKPLEGPDTRTRVLQKGAKDNTPWYAAFNMLRERYRAPNTADLPGRRIEQIFSAHRKAISAYERSLPDLCDQLNQPSVYNFLRRISQMRDEEPTARGLINFLDQTVQVKLDSVLNAFYAQDRSQNLYAYLVFLKYERKREIDEEFFQQLELRPAQVFTQVLQEAPYLRERFATGRWDQLQPSDRRIFSDHLVRRMARQRYGLQVSSWHPRQPIEALIEELRQHGPLQITGTFGKTFYKDPPKAFGNPLEGRIVYGWPKGAEHIVARLQANVILLVGAARLGTRGGLVYFIDPHDDSDPEHPEKQVLYAMSYEKLTDPDCLCDNYGTLNPDAPPSTGYAVYGRPGI